MVAHNLLVLLPCLLFVLFLASSSGQQTYQQPYQQQAYQQPYQQQAYQQPYQQSNGQCPIGYERDGSCTLSRCLQTSQVCQTTSSSCCKISKTQATQAYRRNPKTNQCVLTYCPEGAYNDGTCSTTGICFDQTETCINSECCEKPSSLPSTVQPCTNTGYNTNPYGTGTTYPQTTYPQNGVYPQTTYPQNGVYNQNGYTQTGQIIGYTANGQPIYSSPPTYTNTAQQPVYNTAQQPVYNTGTGQIIGYTANGMPVYSSNPVGTTGQVYPQTGYSPTTYGQTGYSAPYTATGTGTAYPYNTGTNYPYNTGTGTYPYNTGTTGTGTYPYNTGTTGTGYPYNTGTTGTTGIDPTLLAQACQQGDQSSCASAIQTQGCSTTIQMSCPTQCGLCTSYGKKK